MRSSRAGSYQAKLPPGPLKDIPGPDAHVLNHDRKFVSIFCRSRASRHRTRMRTARGVFQVLLQRTVLASIRVRYSVAQIIPRCMERKLESWAEMENPWRVVSPDMFPGNHSPSRSASKSSPNTNVPPRGTERGSEPASSIHVMVAIKHKTSV